MTHNNRPKRTLKSTLIEPFKQIKLGLYVMGVTVVFLAVAGLLFVNAFIEQYQHVMEIFNVVDPQTKWELVVNDVFWANAIKLSAAFITYLAVLFGVIFRMTHRYYGPLVSINRFVRQMANGQYSRRVKIRRGDELGELVEQLNNMAAQLERRHGAEQSDAVADQDDDLEVEQEAS